VLLTIAIGVGVLQGDDAPRRRQGGASRSAPAASRQAEAGSNNPCFVCHMPFQKERLAVVHAKARVWCSECHGPSVKHLEDENIGATPPDVVYDKGQIDHMCGECHEANKHPQLSAETRQTRLAQGEKAQREIKGRKIKAAGVCTDCHGRHWIPPRGQ
jgi:hypothetical protein